MQNRNRPPRNDGGARDAQRRANNSRSGRSSGQHASRTDARSAYRSGRHGASGQGRSRNARSERDARTSRSRNGESRRQPAQPKSGAAGFLAFLNAERALAPLFLFGLVVALFFGKLVWLQVIKAPEFTEQSQAQRTSKIVLEPRRGTIYDRNGVVLATSVDATTIYVNPVEVSDPNLTAGILAQVLGGEAKDYLEKVTASDTYYSIIKRKADTSVGDEVRQLASERVEEAQNKETADAKAAGRKAETIASGIHYVSESRREYPNAQVGGQVVGACSIGVDSDTNREYYYGICGLEAQYNDVLSGTPGYMEQEYGQTGQIIPSGTHEKVDAIDGQDIVVSIDIELQRQVEESLTSGCKGLNAAGGSAVLMDGSTGEIYAAASLPLFNPADRSEVKEGAMQLKAVTDLFEPGSIFKSVSAMAILETGTLTPDSELFCPASITADGYTISDAHERGDATFTLRQILDQSSNVGISLATEKMGFEELYNHIVRYNLHSDTGVDYPGEGEEGTDALGMLGALRPVVGGPGVQRLVRPGRVGHPAADDALLRRHRQQRRRVRAALPHRHAAKRHHARLRHHPGHREHRCPRRHAVDAQDRRHRRHGQKGRYRRIQRGGQDFHGRDLRRGERRLPQERVQLGVHGLFGGFAKQAGVLCGRK